VCVSEALQDKDSIGSVPSLTGESLFVHSFAAVNVLWSANMISQ
jgi:hypothetical protein